MLITSVVIDFIEGLTLGGVKGLEAIEGEIAWSERLANICLDLFIIVLNREMLI